MSFTHGSLFSGIGGFDLAAQNAGFTNVFNCDNNEYCRKVLAKNFPGVPQYDDVNTFNFKGKVDVMSGGFPCQDISYAKQWTSNDAFRVNGIHGQRSGLWWEYLRIIEELRPKFIVAENVEAIHRRGLDEALQSLSQIGYDAEWAVISAARFGAPHLRKRMFIVAYPYSFRREHESLVLGKVLTGTVYQAPQWEPSRTVCRKTGKKTLPEAFGVHDGIPRGLDDALRMEALGNAVVPQVVEPIFRQLYTELEQLKLYS